MIRQSPRSPLFPYSSLFPSVSPFLVHPFPSPFTVISLFSNTFSCPPHSLFFQVCGLPSAIKEIHFSVTLSVVLNSPFFSSLRVAFGNKIKKKYTFHNTHLFCLPLFSLVPGLPST